MRKNDIRDSQRRDELESEVGISPGSGSEDSAKLLDDPSLPPDAPAFFTRHLEMSDLK